MKQNWLNTADGRQGWASWFLKQGYTIYIVDQPQRGRSAYTPGDGKLDTFSAEEMAMMFTAVQKLPLWPQARLHTQWPGVSFALLIFATHFAHRAQESTLFFYSITINIILTSEHRQEAKETKSSTLSSLQMFLTKTIRYTLSPPYSQLSSKPSQSEVQSMMQAAGATLLDKIGPAILITHSEGGPLGFIVADARPDLVKKLISVEPEGPPFKNRFPPGLTVVRPYGLTVIPIAYDPAVTDASPLANKETESAGWDLSKCNLQASPARQLANLSKVPHLVVTGEASFHAMYDYCTVDFLQQGGAKVDYLNLSSYGIHGNAHFLFMELNNLDIAAMIEGWIQNGTLV